MLVVSRPAAAQLTENAQKQLKEACITDFKRRIYGELESRGLSPEAYAEPLCRCVIEESIAQPTDSAGKPVSEAQWLLLARFLRGGPEAAGEPAGVDPEAEKTMFMAAAFFWVAFDHEPLKSCASKKLGPPYWPLTPRTAQ